MPTLSHLKNLATCFDNIAWFSYRFKNTDSVIAAKKHKRERGYTLLELLVVIFILIMVFTLVQANYRDYSRRKALEDAARRLEADLRLAQQYALSGNRPAGCTVLNGYKVSIDTSSNSYSIVADCSPDIAVFGKANIVFSGITLSTSGGDSIKFKSIGHGTNIPSGSTVVITLTQTSTSNAKTLTVNTAGEVR